MSEPRVEVIDPRGAVPDYIAMLHKGLVAAGVPHEIVSTPGVREKVARTGGDPRLVRSPFRLRFRGGLRNVGPYLQGWLVVALACMRRRSNVVHAQWLAAPRLELSLLRALRRLSGVRLVYTVHNVLPHEQSPSDVRMFARVYASCDHVIVHNVASRERLCATVPRLRRENVSVIPHGNYAPFLVGAPSRLRARVDLRIAEDLVVGLCIGKIRRYKGVDVFIEACRLVDFAGLKFSAVVAGHPDDEVYQAEVERKLRTVDQGRRPHIRYLPSYLSDTDLARWMAASDIVILPYRAVDTSGVLLYAMTAGKPVIATRLAVLEEVLGARSGNPLVDVDSAPDLAGAIESLARDRSLRESLGRTNAEAARNRFAWEDIGRETKRVYEAVLGCDQ